MTESSSSSPATRRPHPPPRHHPTGLGKKGVSMRISTATDAVSGTSGGGMREQICEIRPENDRMPKGKFSRRKNQLKNLAAAVRAMTKGGEGGGDDDEEEAAEQQPTTIAGTSRSERGSAEDMEFVDMEEEDDVDDLTGPQYRLRARRQHPVRRKWYHTLHRRTGLSSGTVDGTSEDMLYQRPIWCPVDFNQLLAKYLHWTFRTSFFMLFLSSAFAFFALTLIFAAFIMWFGTNHPSCISVGDSEFGEEPSTDLFSDAFHLSWTTFSTVGYGVIFPNSDKCGGIIFICSLEAFVGVLFAGFCGAILFGKVARIQSRAQVIFSDPIVIRYGSGVIQDEDGEGSTTEGGASDRSASVHSGNGSVPPGRKIPCPVLEFRIVNRLHDAVGGEIMDAVLSASASIDARNANPTIVNSCNPHNRSKVNRRQQKRARLRVPQTSMDSEDKEHETAISDTTASTSIHSDDSHVVDSNILLDPSIIQAITDHQAIDEDSSSLVPRRIFSKMLIESSDHPFFKRVWVARHILNETSPLLTHRARHMVKKNGGFWPAELNSYAAVRQSLHFNQILVSLHGTSNVNAADVYAQKIYDFVDCNVGYSFVNIMFRDPQSGALRVDTAIINDVWEQNGGGAEPFFNPDSGDLEDILPPV